jgi:ribonuclease HI
MADYNESPIQYGVKLTFADGTVINWYRDSKRKTVYAERNPLNHDLPRSAYRVEEIIAAFGKQKTAPTGPPWKDDQGRPIGAFDGGSSPNPGPGGWGVVLPSGEELSGGDQQTTNNRMELMGAITLLERTSGDLRIQGDSRYVLDGITKWIHGWRKRKWLTKAGTPVGNRDLWERLFELTGSRDLVWEHVRGHAGHFLNERCDKLCAIGRAPFQKNQY